MIQNVRHGRPPRLMALQPNFFAVQRIPHATQLPKTVWWMWTIAPFYPWRLEANGMRWSMLTKD